MNSAIVVCLNPIVLIMKDVPMYESIPQLSNVEFGLISVNYRDKKYFFRKFKYLCVLNYSGMKNSFLLLFLMLSSLFATAQTATNVNCNDCAGEAHDFFKEMDEGRVIVLCWVMPCTPCIGPALTTYNVVQSFSKTNPDKVSMYLCDDYANTSCKLINNWANQNGLTNTTRFSNNAINMLDYESIGMPKIVVIGGSDHTVFYNTNNTVDANDLQAAINKALALSSTIEIKPNATALKVSPNPTNNGTTLSFTLTSPSQVVIDLYNVEGRKVGNIHQGLLQAGKNEIRMQLDNYSPGMYLVSISDGIKKQFLNLIKG